MTHTPAEWRGSKAVVLFFLGTDCPVSNGYSPDMETLFARYSRRGVACYGVHADPSIDAENAAAHAKDYRLTFPILLDPAQELARMAGARVTPDAIVASPDGSVLYRGRIDDRYAPDGKRRDVPSRHELVDAIEAVLAGKTPAVRETKAYGCPLPTPRPARR
jgi:peroxiredoxin